MPNSFRPPGFAGGGGADVGLLAGGHLGVGGEALQAADLDRLAFGRFAHAGFLAQRLGRADPGAHAAEDVLVEDRPGGGQCRAGGDLADELGDVDGRRAGDGAGRVMAEIAAVGGDPGLVGREWGVQVGEACGQGRAVEPSGDNTGGQVCLGHGVPPCRRDWQNYGAIQKFYQLENFSTRRLDRDRPGSVHAG
jgi:hypothetical protein